MNATEAFEIAFLGRLKELAATAFAAAGEDASAVKGSRTPALAKVLAELSKTRESISRGRKPSDGISTAFGDATFNIVGRPYRSVNGFPEKKWKRRTRAAAKRRTPLRSKHDSSSRRAGVDACGSP